MIILLSIPTYPIRVYYVIIDINQFFLLIVFDSYSKSVFYLFYILDLFKNITSSSFGFVIFNYKRKNLTINFFI